MKGIKRYLVCIYISHLAAVFVVSAAWWGMVYPEFGFSADTFSAAKLEKEQAGGAENEHTLSGTDAFFALLEAKPGQIRLKSKLLEKFFCNIRGNEDEQQCTDRDF